MRPDPRFSNQPASFWAYVRSLSEAVGYTDRNSGSIKVPTPAEIRIALAKLSLNPDKLIQPDNVPTPLGGLLVSYFSHRADVLNNQTRPSLMTAEEAGIMFARLRKKLRCRLPVTMNKQTGAKKNQPI